MSSHNSKIVVSNEMKVRGELKEVDVELIIHRATIGTYKPPKNKGDAIFGKRAKEAYDSNIMFGAYHAAYPSSDAQTQADGFLEAVSQQCVDKQPILLALDWEHVCVKWKDPKKKDKCENWGIVPPSFVSDFSSRIKEKTGKRIIIYTSTRAIGEFADFFKENNAFTEQFVKMPLWLARYHGKYGLSFPIKKEFAPWPDWIFWQFAEGKGEFAPTARISLQLQNQPIDKNFFNGSRERMRSFHQENSWSCESK